MSDPPASLLVIEEYDDLRETLDALLCLEGYVSVSVASGQHALELLARVSTPPARILLSVRMRSRDAHMFLEQLPNVLRAPLPPVLVYTADPSIEAPLPGSVALLRKPMRAEILLAAVALHLREAS